jgi:hypothetical protein
LSIIDLDFLAAVLCGLVAVCLFSLHVLTSPSRRNWMTLPEYVRRGLFATGVLFMLRSVNFTALPPDGIGHINAEGVLVLVTLAYTVGAITLWVGGKVLAAPGWDRVRHAERQIRADPSQVPVMMSTDEVIDTHSLLGGQVVGPGGGAEELISPRLVRRLR